MKVDSKKSYLLKIGITIGIFSYLEALIIHAINAEIYIKVILTILIFSCLFKLNNKLYVLLALISLPIRFLTEKWSLDNFSFPFFLILLGLVVTEVYEILITFLANYINKSISHLNKGNIEKEVLKVKAILEEP